MKTPNFRKKISIMLCQKKLFWEQKFLYKSLWILCQQTQHKNIQILYNINKKSNWENVSFGVDPLQYIFFVFLGHALHSFWISAGSPVSSVCGHYTALAGRLRQPTGSLACPAVPGSSASARPSYSQSSSFSFSVGWSICEVSFDGMRLSGSSETCFLSSAICYP